MDCVHIGETAIGAACRVYLVAEMSANHGQSFEHAARIVEAARAAGADAVKLQTYTADTITVDCDNPCFRIKGTLWEGRTLHDLYTEACTPWEWQPKLKQVANDLGMDLFSSPFDPTAVEFLQSMDVPAYKVASFEIVDLPLLRLLARTGKPVIMSTGMATLAEIDEAVRALRDAGCAELALLKCTSAYPALPDEMNLRTIPHLMQAFDVPVGLSDHTLGIAVPVAAVALGACIVEKHFTLSRSDRSPDSAFSLEPHEFKAMVDAVRTVEAALGRVSYEPTTHERASRLFRRSLFLVKDIKKGEPFTEENVRSIRPACGLAPKHLTGILGRMAARDIPYGTPLHWDLVLGDEGTSMRGQPQNTAGS